MKLQLLSPAKVLSKAYLRQGLKREQTELFMALRREAELDRLVYALYNLTEEEIALVEGQS